MIRELLASGTLNVAYTIAIFVSFVFAVITFLAAGVADIDLDFDVDVDADVDGGFDFVNISPFALAMFGATFGLVGLITRLWLDMEAIPSIMWATGLGIIIGGGAQAFFFYVLSPSKSSHFSFEEDAIGREAEVLITIPDKGMGEIAYDNRSGRVKLGARSATGKQINRGEFVKIERVSGRVAVVRLEAHE